LNRQTLKVEQGLPGVRRGGLAEQITRHLDNPKKHAAPTGAGVDELVAEARVIRDGFRPIEEAAGVARGGNVEDYIPHLPANPREAAKFAQKFPGSRDWPFFEKSRQLKNLDQWFALGLKPELNVWRLLEARGHAATDALAKKAIDDAVIGAHGVRKPVEMIRDPRKAVLAEQQAGRFARPEEWKTVRDQWAKVSSPHHKGVRVPPEIRDALDRVHSRIDDVTNTPAGLREAGQFARRVGTSWKSLAVTSPGFHLRNLQDDSLRAFFAGARDPRSYADSSRVMRGGDVTVKLRGGGTATGRQLLLEAQALGAVDRGFVKHEIERQVDTITRRRVSAPGHGRVASASRKVGQARENWVRLGTYIDLRRGGMGAEEAARRVRDFHFDYGDVGTLVGVARKFWLPFVTFTSKAVPFTVKQAVSNPGQLAAVNKAMAELNREAGDPDLSLLPVGQRSSFAIPWGGTPETPMLFNPERVAYFGALNQVDPTQVQRQGMGLVTPLVKNPVEVATGHRFFTAGDAPARSVAPNLLNVLAGRGVPVPGYEPPEARRVTKSGRVLPYKTDIVTKAPVASVPWAYQQVAGMLPAYGQATGIAGGTVEDSRIGAYRYFLGLSLNPHDRARAQALAQIFQSRGR